MLIDLTCPVALQALDVLRDDRGRARVYLTLLNLSPRGIARVEALLFYPDAEGARRKTRFAGNPPAKPDAKGLSLSVALPALPEGVTPTLRFLRVSYRDDSPPWVSHPARLVRVPSPQKMRGVALDRLIRLAGPDALYVPALDDHFFSCVCGQINEAGRGVCRRCGRARDTVLARYTPDRLSKAVLDEHPPVEPKAPFQREAPSAEPAPDVELLYRRFCRQRSLLLRRTLTMLALILLLCLVFWSIRSMRAPRLVAPVRMQDGAPEIVVPRV